MNKLANSMLDSLAGQIKVDLNRRTRGREEWAAATLDLCKHLAEAREQFKADQEFSRWLLANGLGDEALAKDDRAAAIAMGEDLKTARKF